MGSHIYPVLLLPFFLTALGNLKKFLCVGALLVVFKLFFS